MNETRNSQQEMVDLFATSTQNISHHLQAIQAEGELADNEGGRKVTADMVRALIPEELAKINAVVGESSTT
jgi:hypothetical protein